MSPIHAAICLARAIARYADFIDLFLIYQSLDQWIERAKDWPEGSKNRRLPEGAESVAVLNKIELRRITATVGEVGEKTARTKRWWTFRPKAGVVVIRKSSRSL